MPGKPNGSRAPFQVLLEAFNSAAVLIHSADQCFTHQIPYCSSISPLASQAFKPYWHNSLIWGVKLIAVCTKRPGGPDE